MRTFDTNGLTGPDDWSGPTFAGLGDLAVKPRWTSKPFRWHRNDGPELFLVLDGEVDMHVRRGADAKPEIVRLGPGQLALIDDGEEHIAHPVGPARILVVERADSE